MVPNIRAKVRRFAPQFRQARASALNESDTVDRIRRFFEDVLGYEIDDISSETMMKNKYVDLCLKIDGTIRLLVEAKAANVKLRDRHIEQAEGYASRNNYQWVLLTNGVEWHLYHLTFDEGIEYERAFVVSLAEDGNADEAARHLALIHKQSIKKGHLDKFWEKASAMCAFSIGKGIFTESVLGALRREIRRSCGVLIDTEDLAKAVLDLMSQEAREAMGPIRIRRKRKPRNTKASPRKESSNGSTEVVSQPPISRQRNP